jgi:hypothetical protein
MRNFVEEIAQLIALEYYRQVKALPPEKRETVLKFTEQALKELEVCDVV